MTFEILLPFISFGLSLILMLFIGSPMIRSLKRLKGAKWAPREDTPDSHLQKAGVPSMGGIGIIGSALVAWLLIIAGTIIFDGLSAKVTGGGFSQNDIVIGAYIVVSIFPFAVFGHMILGYIDDLSKAMKRGGITSKQKLIGQTLLAVGFLIIYSFSSQWLGENILGLDKSPLLTTWWMWPLVLLIIIGTSNAVNLTDGIDGLAAGLSVQVALSFLFITWRQPFENLFTATLFWMCLGGACLGFLAFNKNPAKVFMGDTGSLALGAALGIGAILTKTVFLLPFIGFIFFVEMFSVMAQVAYFKYTKKKFGEGKRIFRRAPLHHHFELGGWREWRVVGTFWAINAVTSILGLALWKAGVLPKFPW